MSDKSMLQLDDSGPGSFVFAAKLRQPALGLFLTRDRLYSRLDAVNAPLVLVHADAGYGKTTLIASYLREHSCQAIWYHVSVTDRIRGTFAAHICHAVAEAFPTIVTPSDHRLATTSDPDMAGATLAAVLGRVGRPLTLVLDEYERAAEDGEIHGIVLALIEHLPPDVRVFLISRRRPPFPLARLEMEGLAQTLTKSDLAFTQEETFALFAHTYDRNLSGEELSLVAHRLEGWAAGLRLTYEAIKLIAERERAQFWARFSQRRALFDYLAEEVLAALPPDTLQFLYRTAIFAWLQPELIEEFLPGRGAAAILDQLARGNLFTTAHNGAGTHYRYHSLLRQYLLRQLQENLGEENVRQLHARAADLCAGRGEIDQAIGHSLAAGQFERASGLLNSLAAHHQGGALLRLMEGSLERAFPEMEGLYGFAWRRIPLSLYELVLGDLRSQAEDPGSGVDPATRAHAQLRLGSYLIYRGRPDEAVAWLTRSRDTFRQTGHRIRASYASTFLGLAYILKGCPEQAQRPVADALELAGNDNKYPRYNALVAAMELALAEHRFADAEHTARAAIDLDLPSSIGGPFGHASLAVALLHQGRRAEALAAATEGVARARNSGVPYEIGHALTSLGMVLREAGDLEKAWEVADEGLAFANGYCCAEARVLLLRADLAVARADPRAQQLWTETCAFWRSSGLSLNVGYNLLIAPLLLGQSNRALPVAAPAETFAIAGASCDSGGVTTPPEGSCTHGGEKGISLVIRTLGVFGLQIAGRDCEPSRWGRAPARRLFFYLLLHRGRLVPRDEILDSLWPTDDPSASTNRLWVTVHALRRELAPLSGIVDRQGQSYRLRLPKGADLDLDRYLMLAERGLSADDETVLLEAISLWQGDFLMEYPYDDFLDTERTRLRDLHKRILLSVADRARSRRESDTALGRYRSVQQLDPFLAEPVQRIMEILLARGEPGAAAEAYRQLSRGLKRELGVDPPGDVQKLYRQALSWVGQSGKLKVNLELVGR